MMKPASLIVALCVVASFLFVPAARSAPAPAAGLRIGTFDSRAVALAHWRSEEGMKKLNGLHEEMAKAKAAGDETRVAELEVEGPGLQVRPHQQVFSTGTISDVLRKIESDLPAIAEQAGVSLLVSKWEVAYQGADVECVDVTRALVDLFSPSEEILAMLEDMDEQPPVPIDELPMDPCCGH